MKMKQHGTWQQEEATVNYSSRVWDWAKELQLKTEGLSIEVFLSKSKFVQTVCHMTARQGHIKLLEKLWAWAKELQLTYQ
jgi:hypothetical protein